MLFCRFSPIADPNLDTSYSQNQIIFVSDVPDNDV